jgi:beta-galactosidase
MNRREFTKLSLASAGFAMCGGTAGAGKLPAIEFTQNHFEIDGKPICLYSGEFDYFRVPKSDWRRRMQLFKDAGGNCLATYIPWLIHEPEEGKFIFGDADGVLDFEGFVETAGDLGLYVIARPGPYQYTEFRYYGLPGWLCENYPAIQARDINGKRFNIGSVSYVHPVFLEKAHRWFKKICPLIAKHTVKNGGSIALTQFDNELTGIHIWNGTLDYNPESMGFGKEEGRYARFLKSRYGDIAELNRMYDTSHTLFGDVRPIAPPGSGTAIDVRRLKDYFEFYLSTVAEYGATLAGWMRELGIDTPLIHNSGGARMNALYLELVHKAGANFLLGSDHYYNLDQNWPQNNPTPQSAIDVFCSLESLRLMGFPPTVLEMPSGSASDWPQFTPENAKTWYWTNLAFGMKGCSYYIFTGGPNPPGTGVTTDIYDYTAPIGATGTIRPLYQVQKELGQFLKERPWLEYAEREVDCRFLFDFNLPRAENYWTGKTQFQLSGGDAWTFFRKGALTSALCAGLSPAFCDLQSEDWLGDTAAPVIAVCCSSMSVDGQKRLVRFLMSGGRVLFAPVLPTYDENLRPCYTLLEFLGNPRIEENEGAFPRISVAGISNVLQNGASYVTKTLPKGAEIRGVVESSGQPSAWSLKTEGGGEAIFLGFRWVHAVNEHNRMIKALLGKWVARQKIVSSNPNLWTSLRSWQGKSILFVMNLWSAPMDGEISYSPTGKAAVHLGRQMLEPMSVKIWEVSD